MDLDHSSFKQSYTDGIVYLQQIGSALRFQQDAIASAMLLYAHYTNSLKSPLSKTQILACMLYSLMNLGKQEIYTAESLLESIKDHRELNSGISSSTATDLLAIIDQLQTFSQRVNLTCFDGRTPNIFDRHMEVIHKLFGIHWEKEPYGNQVVRMSTGAIWDMFRTIRFLDFEQEHWVLAAIHFAHCALSLQDPVDKVATLWKSWIQGGIRWWINLESHPNGIRFDSERVISVLLTDVYTHIDSTRPEYGLLLHPAFQSAPKIYVPGVNKEISFPACVLEDGSTCEEFSFCCDTSVSILPQAISVCSLGQIRALLEIHGHSIKDQLPDDSSCLYRAVERGDFPIVKYVIDQSKKFCPEIIQTPKCTGATPLHIGVYHGYHDIVEYLIEQGAEINTVTVYPNPSTPLYDAINRNHIRTALLLLQHNADVNVRCINGGVCMHAAAFCNSLSIINQLVELAPYQIHLQKAPNGEAPIHIAAQKGNIEAVRALVQANADVNLPDCRYGAFQQDDFHGLTAWHYAIFRQNWDMLNFLSSVGAVPDFTFLKLKGMLKLYHSMTNRPLDESNSESLLSNSKRSKTDYVN
jgi:ankyrin repeat protein